MKLITGRGELIKLSAETGAYIVTRDLDSAWQLIDIAEHLGLHILFPITWREFYSQAYEGKRIKLLFDNASSFLQSMSSAPIIAATFSIGEDWDKELPENR